MNITMITGVLWGASDEITPGTIVWASSIATSLLLAVAMYFHPHGLQDRIHRTLGVIGMASGAGFILVAILTLTLLREVESIPVPGKGPLSPDSITIVTASTGFVLLLGGVALWRLGRGKPLGEAPATSSASGP